MHKQNKVFLAAFVVLLAILIIVILIKAPDSDKSDEKIKIGIMTITSGDLAFLGNNIVQSAELAVEELGYQDKVELIVEDVGGLSGGKDAIAAYRKLVDIDKVDFIIDGMSSDSTLAVAPLLEKDKVVMVTPLTGGENIDTASEYLFRNGPSDIIAGTKPAQDLTQKFGFKKIALFTDNAEYTLDIAKHFRDAFEGDIVLDEIITPDKTDYRTELAKLSGKNVDAIVILTGTGTSAAYLIKQLDQLGNKAPIFANFIAFNGNTLTIAGEATEGVYIYDPEFNEDAEATKGFFTKYKEKFNSNPVIPFHATGTFDAVKMGIGAIESSGNDGEKIHDYLLKNIQGWQGLNGKISFDAQGNTETGFVLKQVKKGKLVNLE